MIDGYKLAKSNPDTGSKYAPGVGSNTVAPVNFSSSSSAEASLYGIVGTR